MLATNCWFWLFVLSYCHTSLQLCVSCCSGALLPGHWALGDMTKLINYISNAYVVPYDCHMRSKIWRTGICIDIAIFFCKECGICGCSSVIFVRSCITVKDKHKQCHSSIIPSAKPPFAIILLLWQLMPRGASVLYEKQSFWGKKCIRGKSSIHCCDIPI